MHSGALWPTEPDDTNSRPNWRDIIEDIVAADLNTIETLLRAIQDRLGNNTYGGGASEFFATPVAASLSLTINPGLLVTATGTLSWIAAQTTSTLTAPVTNPRIDVAALDTTTGAVSWVAGSEGASPTVPTVPAGKAAIWAVYLRVGATAIDRFGYDTGTNSYLYRDMRAALGGGGASGIPATILDAKGDLIAASAADTATRVAVGTNGQVLTADSGVAAGVSWQTPGGGSGDVTYAALTAIALVNEVMNGPMGCYVPNDSDLVTLNLWWDDLGSPTTRCTFVDVGGEGISEKFEYALKVVGDAAAEGFYQRFTYADQPRIKGGEALSAVVWVYSVNAGTVTAELVSSASTVIASATTTTEDAWTKLTLDNVAALDGTYVDLKIRHSASAFTLYAVPSVNMGAKGLWIPSPRPTRYVDKPAASVVSGVDPGGAGYTDVDITANTSNLAFMAQVMAHYINSTTNNKSVRVRRNGSADDGLGNEVVRNTVTTGGMFHVGSKLVPLDDGQVFEYDTDAVAGDSENLYLTVAGWWEWA